MTMRHLYIYIKPSIDHVIRMKLAMAALILVFDPLARVPVCAGRQGYPVTQASALERP